MSRRYLMLPLAAMALMLAPVGGAWAGPQLITNGTFIGGNKTGWYGFESNGPQDPNPYKADSIETNPSSVYGLPSYNGYVYNLEVNANAIDTVYTVVTGLVIGQYYALSYGFGGRNGASTQLNVYFGNYDTSSAQNLTAGLTPATEIHTNSYTNGGALSWQTNSFLVLATASVEELVFQSVYVSGNTTYGNEISDVSLIPEPGEASVLVAGLGMLALARRRRAA